MMTFGIVLVSVIGVAVPPVCFWLGRVYEREHAPTIPDAVHPTQHGADAEWADTLHGLKEPAETVVEPPTEPDPIPDYLAEIASLREAIDRTMADTWAEIRTINGPKQRKRRD